MNETPTPTILGTGEFIKADENTKPVDRPKVGAPQEEWARYVLYNTYGLVYKPVAEEILYFRV